MSTHSDAVVINEERECSLKRRADAQHALKSHLLQVVSNLNNCFFCYVAKLPNTVYSRHSILQKFSH